MRHNYLLTLAFVCKTLLLSEGSFCPSGWILFGQSCYHIGSIGFERSWIESMSTCQHSGGYLVNINTEQEQNFIMQFIHSQNKVADEYWIGGSDRHAEGRWVWEPSNNLISHSYSHWQPGQPNNRHGQENCMSVYTTRSNGYDTFWFDDDCVKALSYICEKGIQSPTTPTLHTNPTAPTASLTGVTGCLHGWTKYGQSCYHISGFGNEQNWMASMSTCQGLGGYLLSIETQQEQNFIMQFIHSQVNVADEYWLGGSDRLVEGIWRWELTRNLISHAYSHWRPGQPNNRDGRENCMSIYTTSNNGYDSYWFDEYCEKSLSYICEMGILTTTTTTTPAATTPTTSVLMTTLTTTATTTAPTARASTTTAPTTRASTTTATAPMTTVTTTTTTTAPTTMTIAPGLVGR